MDRNTCTSSDVAVIIPAHSWPQYLPEALDSICVQTVPPAAVIVVLDGPPNLREYEAVLKQYPGIMEVWLPSNQGPSAARNAGARAAALAGLEWMAFLDEDDLLHPRFLEKMLLSRQICPDRAIHYCDHIKFGKGEGYTRTPEYTLERLLAGPFIIAPSLVKMEAWEDVKNHNGYGFDPALRGWEDYQFFLECGILGHHGARVGLGLVRVRSHSISSTSAYAHRHLNDIVAHIRDKLKRLYDVDLTYEVPDGLHIRN